MADHHGSAANIMQSRTAAALMAAVMLLALPAGTFAHGYMKEPMSRNWLVAGQRQQSFYSPQKFYSPMSLNRAGKATNGATCGSVEMGNDDFEVGGKFATRRIVATYKAGQTISTTVKITNNHWGYIDFRLCPLKGTSAASEHSGLSENCLNKYTLKRTKDGTDKYYIYHGKPGAQFFIKSRWKLPHGITCPRCILQWRYVSGHMCYLPGVDKAKMLQLAPGGSDPCPSNYLDNYAIPSEKFWGCADVKIT